MTIRKPEDQTPFSLGFPGEYWDVRLDCLIVPVPGAPPYMSLMVALEGESDWIVYYREGPRRSDSALMAACLVQARIDQVTTEVTSEGGNNVLEEKQDGVVEELPPT